MGLDAIFGDHDENGFTHLKMAESLMPEDFQEWSLKVGLQMSLKIKHSAIFTCSAFTPLRGAGRHWRSAAGPGAAAPRDLGLH